MWGADWGCGHPGAAQGLHGTFCLRHGAVGGSLPGAGTVRTDAGCGPRSPGSPVLGQGHEAGGACVPAPAAPWALHGEEPRLDMRGQPHSTAQPPRSPRCAPSASLHLRPIKPQHLHHRRPRAPSCLHQPRLTSPSCPRAGTLLGTDTSRYTGSNPLLAEVGGNFRATPPFPSNRSLSRTTDALGKKLQPFSCSILRQPGNPQEKLHF